MHAEAVCDTLAKFYIEWSWELEQVGNLKKAEQTFNLGLQKVAGNGGGLESREILATKHKQFQARVMKKMLEKSNDESEMEAAAG
jgi:hypothetical protein